MGNLGNHCETYPLASVHFKKCFELCEDNMKLFGETPVTLRDNSRMAINMGHLHSHAGNNSEAEKYFLKAPEYSRTLVHRYGATSENLYEFILAIEPLGQSGELFREQLKLIDLLRDLREPSIEDVGRIIYSMNLAASRHEKHGDHKEALAMRRESLRLAEIIFSENSVSESWLLTLTEQYYFLSQTLKNLNLHEESDDLMKTAHSHAIDYSKRSNKFSGDDIKDQIEQALGLIDYSDFYDDDTMTDEDMDFFDNLNQVSIQL